jgi:hypothetical protein
MASICPTTRTFGGYSTPYDTMSTGYGYPGFEMPSKLASILNREVPFCGPCPPTTAAGYVPSTFDSRFATPSSWFNNAWTNNTWATGFPTTQLPVNQWMLPYEQARLYNNVCPPWVNPMNYASWMAPEMYYRQQAMLNGNVNWPVNYNTFGGVNTSTTSPVMGSHLYNINFRPTCPIEFYTLTNPIRVLDREGNRQLWLCFDLRGYKPEEINVTLNKTERCIVVEATHENKEGKEHQIMRKFYRKFALPETLAKVDITKCELKSCFTPEGLLVVECFLPKMTVEEIAKCPIMTRAFTTPYGVEGYFGCPSTCNTTPINCKIN